jgi:uncharacterized protein (TIGR03790 family)
MHFKKSLYFISFLLILFTAKAHANCDLNLPVAGARNDVLVLVNDNSIDSCEVGRYYAEKRRLGQSNILHIYTPANYFISTNDFILLRDQVIAHLQKRIQQDSPGTLIATCPPGEGPLYCDAVVSTKGVPSRFRFDGSKLGFALSPTSLDNYLRFWLVNYYAQDTQFSSTSILRARAFGNGSSMRVVDPAVDKELIVGRLDGITLGSTKALIDRILLAEANGLYGKAYSFTGRASLNGSTGMRWKDYTNGNRNIYEGAGAPWRYQFGLFNDATPECSDYLDPNHYLNFSPTTTQGKAPQDCTLKLAVGLNWTSEVPPATPGSRTPLVDDATLYFGHLDGQSTTGSFNRFLNWRKDTTCSNTLCENLPTTEQAACRIESTDVYKEIDTRCVGVSDSFMGFNYQSFPVSFMNIAPTGWLTGTAESFLVGRAEVREDIGFDDTFSLWYRNTEEIVSPLCYATSDFSQAPATACIAQHVMAFGQKINFPTVQTSDPTTPNQYRVRFKYKAENLNRNVPLQAYLQIREAVGNKAVNYSRVTAVTAIGNAVGGWQDAEAILTIDHANMNHSATWDGTYRTFTFNLVSSGSFSGDIGVDNVSFSQIMSTGDIDIALVNPSFSEGHKQVTTGDHAANFLSRLNGVAFWGSLSHHQSGGHSFSSHQLETLIYFMRGLPLGDAVWFSESYHSGMFYGDPIYSPMAIKLDTLTNHPEQFVLAQTATPLTGSAVNGRDGARVSTLYNLDYCAGDDFYVCDRNAQWVTTGLSGVGGQEGLTFGAWNTSLLAPGKYTIRLQVTSSNTMNGRSQTFYDYQTINLYNTTSDYDNDGLTDVQELAAGSVTSPTNPDMDNDGLLDGEEVNTYHTDPNNRDTDGDNFNDLLEIQAGLNPLVNDTNLDNDQDGVSNSLELLNGTNPNDATSKPIFSTYYVDNTNLTGIEDGSAANPYTLLNDAIIAAKHGDTIQMAAGEYELLGSFFQKSLRIIGQGTSQTTITTTANLYIYNWFWGEISNVRFNTNYGLIFWYMQNTHISQCEIHSQYTGLNINFSPSLVIDHCLIVGADTGLALQYNVNINDDILLSHITFDRFAYAFNDNVADAANLEKFVITNSIINAAAESASPIVSPPNVHYSLVNLTTGSNEFAGTKGNLSTDPRFVDAVNGDYHLLPTSPAIATGDPASDYSQEPIPNGARVNMGYYGGTSEAALLADADLDHLPDGYELAVGLDHVVANTYADADNDGRHDYLEYWEGTNPLDATNNPLYRYILLNPKMKSVELVSQTVDNVLLVNEVEYILQPLVATTIPEVSQGTILEAQNSFSAGSLLDTTDSPVPFGFIGHEFVIPHFRNNHKIYLFSPYGNTEVIVSTTNGTNILNLGKGSIEVLSLESLNNQSTVITSERPILVAHAGYTSGDISRDAYPVPPAVKQIWGVKSRSVFLGATQDNTQVTITSSDGQTNTVTLNKGNRYRVAIGSNLKQGQGAALQISANKPIAAIQGADSDGIEQTAFLGQAWLTTKVSLPTATQYIAIACPFDGQVTLYDQNNQSIGTQSCTNTSSNPGKVYFGSQTNGINIQAGSYISSDVPVFVIYENSNTNDERNIFGDFTY